MCIKCILFLLLYANSFFLFSLFFAHTQMHAHKHTREHTRKHAHINRPSDRHHILVDLSQKNNDI